MGQFEIEYYTVETVHEGRNKFGSYQRFIVLEGPEQDNGEWQRAVLVFMDDERLYSDKAGFFTSSGVLWSVLRIRDFRDVYDILRNEEPVYCYYSSTDNSVWHVSVTTGREPVGEGPIDTSGPPLFVRDIIEEATEFLP